MFCVLLADAEIGRISGRTIVAGGDPVARVRGRGWLRDGYSIVARDSGAPLAWIVPRRAGWSTTRCVDVYFARPMGRDLRMVLASAVYEYHRKGEESHDGGLSW